MPNTEYQADQPKTPEQTNTETTVEHDKGLDESVIQELIIPRLSKALEAAGTRNDIYSRLESLYFGNIAKDSPSWNLPTHYSSGIAFQLVETVMPMLTSTRLGADITGVEENDDESASIAEQTLNYQIENFGLARIITDCIRQSAKTIGALKVDYQVKPVTTTHRKKMWELKIPFTQKRIGVGPMQNIEKVDMIAEHILETIPFEDLVIPPGRSNDTLPFIGIKTSKKVREMQDDKRYNADGVKALLDMLAANMKEDKSIPDEYKIERGAQQELNMDLVMPLLLEKEIPLIEAYCQWKDEIYRVQLTEETNTIMMSERLTFWHKMYPIRLLSFYPIENQAIGASLLQVVEHDINEYDTWNNIIMSVGLFDLQRPIIYDKDKMSINWGDNPVRYEPGAMFPSTDVGAAKLLETPYIRREHMLIADNIYRRIQNKTGLTDYISGVDDLQQDKTLGEVQLKTAQSKKRFTSTVDNIRTFLSDVFFMMNSNNQQFLPDRYEIRVLGRRGYKTRRVNAESIQGRFDFHVRGFEDVTADEAQKVNKYRAMISDAMTLNRAAGAPLIDIPYLARKLYEDGYSVRDVDNIVIPVQDTLQSQDQSKQDALREAHEENLAPLRAVLRPDQNHAVHLDVHTAYFHSPAFQTIDKTEQIALVRHIEATRQALAAQQQPMGPGVMPPGAPMGPGGQAGGPPMGLGGMTFPADMKVRYPEAGQ